RHQGLLRRPLRPVDPAAAGDVGGRGAGVDPAGDGAPARRRRPRPGLSPLAPPAGAGRHRRRPGPRGGGARRAEGGTRLSSATRFDPDALASLESERDFLLRSIADLETERAAGNLDDERYQALKDDYTARAAAVLRSIEEGHDARPPAPPVPKKRKLLTGGAVLAFVVVAGRRPPGQTITGNAQSGSATSGAGGALPVDDAARRAALERQVKEHPDDASAHLVFARYLLEKGEATEAVREYVATARLDPKNAEANAYAGWVSFVAAQSANADPKTAAELTDRALDRLNLAVAAN